MDTGIMWQGFSERKRNIIRLIYPTYIIVSDVTLLLSSIPCVE